MIRLLGAITGSALALATLLILIGIPQFKTQTIDPERAVVTLPLPTTPVDTPKTGVMTPRASVDEPVASVAETAKIAAADHAVVNPDPELEQPGTPNDSVSRTQPVRETSAMASTLEVPAVDTPQMLDTAQSWYAFWSPFRSELAANGFISQLQSITGLDYRVVRIKPGVYEVAFAYDDDDDIPANLTQITAATGLELPQ